MRDKQNPKYCKISLHYNILVQLKIKELIKALTVEPENGIAIVDRVALLAAFVNSLVSTKRHFDKKFDSRILIHRFDDRALMEFCDITNF